jgi:hypothetical protein
VWALAEAATRSTSVRVVGGEADNIISANAHAADLLGAPALRRLAHRSFFLPVTFQVHLDRPVLLGKGQTACILLGSPWEICIDAKEATFAPRVPLCDDGGGGGGGGAAVRGSWSVLAGQDGVPGVLFGKPLCRCSEEEIHRELWAQIMRNRALQRNIREANGFALSAAFVVRWSPVWPTYFWQQQQQQRPPSRSEEDELPAVAATAAAAAAPAPAPRLVSSEPKFSNNAGTLELRPAACVPALRNAFVGTAYCREALDVFSMEGAAIGGLCAAAGVAAAGARPCLLRAGSAECRAGCLVGAAAVATVAASVAPVAVTVSLCRNVKKRATLMVCCSSSSGSSDCCSRNMPASAAHAHAHDVHDTQAPATRGKASEKRKKKKRRAELASFERKETDAPENEARPPRFLPCFAVLPAVLFAVQAIATRCLRGGAPGFCNAKEGGPHGRHEMSGCAGCTTRAGRT